MNRINELGQPIGFALPEWSPPPRPPREALRGHYCRVEPLDVARHAAELYAANALDAEGRMWTYLPYGPFATVEEYTSWVQTAVASDDPQFYAIIEERRGCAVGIASYLRIAPAAGAIEVGSLAFSPKLQRTPAATEAMYLMMRQTFALGYRRYEWKCDLLNVPSRAAAERLGFTFEGIFRQAIVYKGRNRDTAWYSILDREWPALDAAYTQWLDPANFDSAGRQQSRLADLIAAARS